MNKPWQEDLFSTDQLDRTPHTVFLFEPIICDKLIGEDVIALCGFDDLWP